MQDGTGPESRSLALLGVLAFGVALGALGWPLLWGEAFQRGDLVHFHLPFRFYYAECLASGEDFRWCPYVFAGFDLHGEGQIGMYHPLHWVLYRFLPLAGAFALEWFASYVFAFAGTVVLLRSWGMPAPAAVLGALTFALSPYHVGHFNHTNLVVVGAHLPWMLWSLEGSLRAPEAWRAAAFRIAFALILASQFLLGHPQALWYNALMSAVYGAFVTIKFHTARRGPLLVWALALGILLGAIQWLPTWELLAISTRTEPTPGLLAFGSLSPINLIQICCPYLLLHGNFEGNPEEFMLYPGSIGVASVVWILRRRSELGELGAKLTFLLAFSVLLLFLSFGSYTPLLEWHNLLPVVGKFRCPGRYVSLIQFVTALCSAVAFADLIVVAARGPLAWQSLAPLAWLPAVSIVLTVGATAWLHLEPASNWPDHVTPSLGGFIAGPILATGAASLLALVGRGQRCALWLLVPFAAADHAAHGASWMSDLYRPAPIQSLLAPTMPMSIPDFRMAGGDANEYLKQGLPSVRGWVALFPKKQLTSSSAALRLAGVATDQPGLPRVRLVTHAQVSTDPDADVLAIDLEKTALTDQALHLPPGTPGHVKRERDRPGLLDLTTQTPSRQLVVWAESWHPGWEVRIAGQPAPIVRLYGDFMGCVVDAGDHRVEFRYRPASFTWGLVLASLGLLGLATLLYPWLPRRPDPTSPAEAS